MASNSGCAKGSGCFVATLLTPFITLVCALPAGMVLEGTGLTHAPAPVPHVLFACLPLAVWWGLFRLCSATPAADSAPAPRMTEGEFAHGSSIPPPVQPELPLWQPMSSPPRMVEGELPPEPEPE